jgi:hypothetical protein
MKMQKGESRVGCILYILIVLYIAIMAIQIVPVLYNNLQLKDEMGQMASSYYQFHGHPEKIYKILTDKARALDLPIGKKDFKILRRSKSIEISAHYEVEVNFLFMKKKIKLNPEVSKPAYNF